MDKANNLWNTHLQNYEGDIPIFMSLNLETPLAFSTFLAANSHLQKVYIPSTFSMNKILQSLHTQDSKVVVCDQELYDLEVPQSKQAEFSEYTKTVEKVIVAGKTTGGKSALFNAEATSFDAYNL